jgi:hypothetical protein
MPPTSGSAVQTSCCHLLNRYQPELAHDDRPQRQCVPLGIAASMRRITKGAKFSRRAAAQIAILAPLRPGWGVASPHRLISSSQSRGIDDPLGVLDLAGGGANGNLD